MLPDPSAQESHHDHGRGFYYCSNHCQTLSPLLDGSSLGGPLVADSNFLKDSQGAVLRAAFFFGQVLTGGAQTGGNDICVATRMTIPSCRDVTKPTLYCQAIVAHNLVALQQGGWDVAFM